MPTRILLSSFAFLCLLALSLLLAGGGPAAAQQEWEEHGLWSPYWSVAPGFTSTLEMKNNRLAETLTVNVSLYFGNGEEYYLAPFQLNPRQTVVLNLNYVIESLPAPVRARAGNEGTAEVRFAAPNFSALMGSISVSHPERGIAWNFRLYPRGPDTPVVPVRGLFWFYDSQTDGFVAIQNASEDYIQVTPRFQVASAYHPAPAFALAPGQGYKLELRRTLSQLGLAEATAGGIELAFDGPPDAVKAHGVLFNNHGFSAEIDFNRFDQWPEARNVTLRTPRFPVGPADPRLGLPAPTSFEPFLVLHNFNGHPLEVTASVG